MKPKIILLNAPPRSGKDTIADFIAGNDGTYTKMSFASPIKMAMASFFGLSNKQFEAVDGDAKDKELDIFFGKSFRQVCISFAEDHIRKEYGVDAFAKALYQRYVHKFRGKNIVIPDLGFPEELEYMIEKFGEENINIIYISREGRDWSNDSRDWVKAPKGVKTFFIENNQPKDKLYTESMMMFGAIKTGNPYKSKKFDATPKKKAENVKE